MSRFHLLFPCCTQKAEIYQWKLIDWPRFLLGKINSEVSFRCHHSFCCCTTTVLEVCVRARVWLAAIYMSSLDGTQFNTTDATTFYETIRGTFKTLALSSPAVHQWASLRVTRGVSLLPASISFNVVLSIFASWGSLVYIILLIAIRERAATENSP